MFEQPQQTKARGNERCPGTQPGRCPRPDSPIPSPAILPSLTAPPPPPVQCPPVRSSWSAHACLQPAMPRPSSAPPPACPHADLLFTQQGEWSPCSMVTSSLELSLIPLLARPLLHATERGPPAQSAHASRGYVSSVGLFFYSPLQNQRLTKTVSWSPWPSSRLALHRHCPDRTEWSQRTRTHRIAPAGQPSAISRNPVNKSEAARGREAGSATKSPDALWLCNFLDVSVHPLPAYKARSRAEGVTVPSGRDETPRPSTQ